MTVSGQRNKSMDDLLCDIDPRVITITRDFLAEQTITNPNVQFVRRKTDIVNGNKKGYAITGILLERTKNGPKPLLSGRIDIYSPADYDIFIACIDKSYISQARALRDKLKDELYK